MTAAELYRLPDDEQLYHERVAIMIYEAGLTEAGAVEILNQAQGELFPVEQNQR